MRQVGACVRVAFLILLFLFIPSLSLSSINCDQAGCTQKDLSTIGARVFNSANQSIPNATNTAVTFNSERYDTDSIHSTAVNTSRLTAVHGGKYLITCNVFFDANATGIRDFDIRLNGVTFISAARESVSSAAVGSSIITTTIYNLAATDYVECVVFQNSGGALNTLFLPNFSQEFMMTLIQQ